MSRLSPEPYFKNLVGEVSQHPYNYNLTKSKSIPDPFLPDLHRTSFTVIYLVQFKLTVLDLEMITLSSNSGSSVHTFSQIVLNFQRYAEGCQLAHIQQKYLEYC